MDRLGGLGEEILSREETQVAGRDGVVVEAEATGEALLPQGIRSYRYYLRNGEGTLVASTYAVEGLDYEHTTRVLDAMVSRLDFIE